MKIFKSTELLTLKLRLSRPLFYFNTFALTFYLWFLNSKTHVRWIENSLILSRILLLRHRIPISQSFTFPICLRHSPTFLYPLRINWIQIIAIILVDVLNYRTSTPFLSLILPTDSKTIWRMYYFLVYCWNVGIGTQISLSNWLGLHSLELLSGDVLIETPRFFVIWNC